MKKIGEKLGALKRILPAEEQKLLTIKNGRIFFGEMEIGGNFLNPHEPEIPNDLVSFIKKASQLAKAALIEQAVPKPENSFRLIAMKRLLDRRHEITHVKLPSFLRVVNC